MRRPITAALLSLAALTGCASYSDPATLNVTPASAAEQYVTTFDRAMFSTNDGRTDIVLLSGSDAADGTTGVRQTVHVKVLWTPTRTIRLDSPSAGNAMIDWQVTAGDGDKVEYGGSCWAKVDVDGDEAEIDLREANVSVRRVTGRMADPLKAAKLQGKFLARRADATVKAYVSDMTRGSTATAANVPAPRAAGR